MAAQLSYSTYRQIISPLNVLGNTKISSADVMRSNCGVNYHHVNEGGRLNPLIQLPDTLNDLENNGNENLKGVF